MARIASAMACSAAMIRAPSARAPACLVNVKNVPASSRMFANGFDVVLPAGSRRGTNRSGTLRRRASVNDEPQPVWKRRQLEGHQADGEQARHLQVLDEIAGGHRGSIA